MGSTPPDPTTEIQAPRSRAHRAGRRALWLLGLVLSVVGVDGNPMILVFPMGIFVFLCRETLRRAVRDIPFGVSFLGLGLAFGLLTETFAILNNRHLPPEERILLSPDPILDLAYGVFYYLMVIGTWDALILAFRYSKTEVFVITGLFGVLTEEVGQVFLRIFQEPVVGALYALVVALIYGIFPTLAYLVGEKNLRTETRGTLAIRFLAAALALFLQWAVYGLVVLPALKRIPFPRR